MDLNSSEDDTVVPMPLPDDANPDMLDTLTTISKHLLSAVSTDIRPAQENQKRAFDRRHNSSKEISDCSTIYIQNQKHIHRMGSKMEPRWIEPYTVVESLTKGRVKLRNNKTGKILCNTYHANNLKIYQEKEAPPSPHSPEDCPRDVDNDSPKRKILKIPREESDTDDIHISETYKQTKTFNPLPSSGRKCLSTALGLTFHKVVYCGRTGDLGLPRHTYKTKGDGNCNFRAISYMLTGSEDNHSLL